MRRWPADDAPDLDLALGRPSPYAQAAGVRGDRVRPFNCSGGRASWLDAAYGSGFPTSDGAQLLCSQYVAEGHVGFVKMIKAAPFKPSVLHNSQYTELVPGLQASFFPHGNSPDSDNGWWSTPFGWEGYTDFPTGGGLGANATWRWHLQLMQGTIESVRNAANVPPFSLGDPNSWLLVPDEPVPASAYQGGFPGVPPADWGPQRLQWWGWESGEVHIVVPEDTTVLLFARWTQEPYNPFYQATDGAGVVDLGRDVYILGPSFGQLVGYTQPYLRKAAGHNAAYGWQS